MFTVPKVTRNTFLALLWENTLLLPLKNLKN
jgi:hypothetical protein